MSHEEPLEHAQGFQEAISALEERVFTIDPRTGHLVKVQKVDRGSGRLRELSNSEYVSLVAGYSALVWLGLLVAEPTLRAAYDRGVQDCRTWWQLACSGYWSSEEQAYFQWCERLWSGSGSAGCRYLGDRAAFPTVYRAQALYG